MKERKEEGNVLLQMKRTLKKIEEKVSSTSTNGSKRLERYPCRTSSIADRGQ